MRLSTATVREFKNICAEEFDLMLSDEEASVHASRLLELLWLLVVESNMEASDATLC